RGTIAAKSVTVECGRSPLAHRVCPRGGRAGRCRGAGAAGRAAPRTGGVVRLRPLLRRGGGPRRGGRPAGRPGASHRLRGGGGGRGGPPGRGRGRRPPPAPPPARPRPSAPPTDPPG